METEENPMKCAMGMAGSLPKTRKKGVTVDRPEMGEVL